MLFQTFNYDKKIGGEKEKRKQYNNIIIILFTYICEISKSTIGSLFPLKLKTLNILLMV